MVCKYLILIIVFLNIIICFSQSQIDQAINAYRQKDYIQAVELFKKSLVEENDNNKVDAYLKYIGDCYFLMGFYDKAQFYYEKLIDENTPVTVLDNLFKIFVLKKDFKNAENILEMFPDGPGKDKLYLTVYEYKKDNERLYEVLFRLYNYYNEIEYFERLIKIDAQKTAEFFNRDFDRFIYDFITQDGNLPDNRYEQAYKEMTSSDKIRAVMFLENKNHKKSVFFAEKLYAENKSDNDFERYLRVLFKTGNIQKMKEEINKRKKLISSERFLNTHFSLLNSLALNDEIISVIKSIRDYNKDKDNIYKLVAVYRTSMSYNAMYSELEKALNEKSLQKYEVENIIDSLISNINWAKELLLHNIFNILSPLLKAKAYHYSGNYIKTIDILYENTSIIEMFVNSVRAHSIYAGLIDIKKVNISDITVLLDYFSLERLEELVRIAEDENDIINIVELIMRKKYISFKEFQSYIQKNELVENFIKRLSIISGVPKYEGVDFYKNIFEKMFIIDNARKYAIVDGQFDLMRLFAIMFFNERYYDVALGLYEELFLKKDFLYLCIRSIKEKDIIPDVRMGTMFYELELADIVLSEDNTEKRIAELFFKKENNDIED